MAAASRRARRSFAASAIADHQRREVADRVAPALVLLLGGDDVVRRVAAPGEPAPDRDERGRGAGGLRRAHRLEGDACVPPSCETASSSAVDERPAKRPRAPGPTAPRGRRARLERLGQEHARCPSRRAPTGSAAGRDDRTGRRRRASRISAASAIERRVLARAGARGARRPPARRRSSRSSTYGGRERKRRHARRRPRVRARRAAAGAASARGIGARQKGFEDHERHDDRQRPQARRRGRRARVGSANRPLEASGRDLGRRRPRSVECDARTRPAAREEDGRHEHARSPSERTSDASIQPRRQAEPLVALRPRGQQARPRGRAIELTRTVISNGSRGLERAPRCARAGRCARAAASRSQRPTIPVTRAIASAMWGELHIRPAQSIGSAVGRIGMRTPRSSATSSARS